MLTINKMKNEGFTLLISIMVMGTLLLIASGVVSLAFKQSLISSSGRESQNAFYAADTGMECAIYWDIKNSSGQSAFATTTGSQIVCNNQTMIVGGSSQSVFTFNLSPEPYCAIVKVTKNADNTTLIESKGYNTCDVSNPRRVERAVRASY